MFTNGVTARYLSSRKFPSLRRGVRTPKRWDRIVEIAQQHGFKLPVEPDPRPLNEFLVKQKVADPLRFPDLSLARSSSEKLHQPLLYPPTVPSRLSRRCSPRLACDSGRRRTALLGTPSRLPPARLPAHERRTRQKCPGRSPADFDQRIKIWPCRTWAWASRKAAAKVSIVAFGTAGSRTSRPGAFYHSSKQTSTS